MRQCGREMGGRGIEQRLQLRLRCGCDSFLVSAKLRIRSWTAHSTWLQLQLQLHLLVVVAQLPGATRIKSEAWLTAMAKLATWGRQHEACSMRQAAGSWLSAKQFPWESWQSMKKHLSAFPGADPPAIVAGILRTVAATGEATKG